ncbi:MAG: hypothetical protein IT258_21245 [Saprospiraceae bacterium]|nr:hypothetical protein [Saprospiraceae bacterium]
MQSFKRIIFSAAGIAFCLGLHAQNGVSLRPKVYLQAALHGLSPAATLMRDDLRAEGLLPMTEPYTGLANFQHKGGGGGETIANAALLQATGPDAIVDWVVVELRTSSSATNAVLATSSALVQRDGDVVAADGQSPVIFSNVDAGQYHVVIRHRNHLSIMTNAKVSLSQMPVTVNFTDPNTAVCQYGQKIIGGKAAMWAGDCSRDGRVIVTGPSNDRSILLLRGIIGPEATGNTNLESNYINKRYSIYDLNMDGKVIYQGAGNDVELVFHNIVTYPPNTTVVSNYILPDCLPE